jgi:hypothetical protein
MADKKQQSPNWKKLAKEYMNYNETNRIPGFPFNEGFPKGAYAGKIYKLIDVNGFYHKAMVDDSREFMSEGLEWKITGNGNMFGSSIAAWKEI